MKGESLTASFVFKILRVPADRNERFFWKTPNGHENKYGDRRGGRENAGHITPGFTTVRGQRARAHRSNPKNFEVFYMCVCGTEDYAA